MSWRAVEIKNGERHIMPIDDLKPHFTAMSCWCRPTEDIEDTAILIHHSLDRREDYENGRLRPA